MKSGLAILAAVLALGALSGCGGGPSTAAGGLSAHEMERERFGMTFADFDLAACREAGGAVVTLGPSRLKLREATLDYALPELGTTGVFDRTGRRINLRLPKGQTGCPEGPIGTTLVRLKNLDPERPTLMLYPSNAGKRQNRANLLAKMAVSADCAIDKDIAARICPDGRGASMIISGNPNFRMDGGLPLHTRCEASSAGFVCGLIEDAPGGLRYEAELAPSATIPSFARLEAARMAIQADIAAMIVK